jgi:hypothetical protein
MDLNWSDDRMKMAQKIVLERFAQNSVAGHLAPHSTVDDTETTVRGNRFDFAQTIVIDREVLNLNEPFSFCWFTKAQVDEFGATQGEDVSQTKWSRRSLALQATWRGGTTSYSLADRGRCRRPSRCPP